MKPSARPIVRSGLATAELDGRFVVFDPRDRTLTELRPDAGALLPALDGEASIAVLTRDLQEATGLTDDACSAHLRAILAPLLEAGLVTLEPAHPADGPA